MNQTNIKHINSLHSEAFRGIEFYKQELQILQERLEEIAGANSSNEVALQVEHFQNQLIIQNSNLDDLKSRLKANIKTIESQVQNSQGYLSNEDAATNVALYDGYLFEEKVISDLRHEFNKFAAKWL